MTWPEPAPHVVHGLAPRLVRWQREHGRHGLPWQATREPYLVWLSEVMLQQTQVSTVLGYYARFIERFPDVPALASAQQSEVLALWSGLGYYSRARNLHRCAQVVMAKHGGQFPCSAAQLQALPGIGPSTAAAIAAFCFGERSAILDGNVKRVLARVLAFEADLATVAAHRQLLTQAQALLPEPQDMPAYTQGLMDLGATVCTIRAPACQQCPLAALCLAREAGRAQQLPVKTRRLRRSARHSAWLWLEHAGAVWLAQRPDSGVWAGLLSLPEYPSMQALLEAASAWPGQGTALRPFTHVLTHLDWHFEPLRWYLPARLPQALRAQLEQQLAAGAWHPVNQLHTLPIPAALSKLHAQLDTTPLLRK